VAATVSAFDLSVFPSLWEGTPITAFEALAMGKPIVATDADGLLDILTPDRDAVIVPKRNPDALADKIVWAMDRPLERETSRRSREAERTALRHRRLRAEDGAVVSAAARCLATERAPGHPDLGPVVSSLMMASCRR
jgi:glycosyltransferase involved in cell wall biosynthesis